MKRRKGDAGGVDTTKTRATAQGRGSDVARGVAIFVVIVSILTVVAHLGLSLYFEPVRIVDRKIEEIAKDYYETYFYPNYATDSTGDELDEKMDKFAENGFSRTYLRQLLLFDEGRHADEAKYFKYNGYTCDTNETYVKYYPIAPYGVEDYRVEYYLQCG